MAEGRRLHLVRGRILAAPHRAPPRHMPAPAAASTGAVILLACCLPMFAQSFQYMTDIPPLYLLSKAWPFLLLPAGLWAMARLSVPCFALHAANLLWLLAISPAIGILQLGNGFPDAMVTTVKVWSFTYVFSAAAILVLLRPEPGTLRRILLGYGVATFALMLGMWVTVPVAAYGGGDLATKLFMTDPERGYRIYMPMFFGVLLMLWLNRSMMLRFKIWKPVAIAICLILLLTIYKQRTAIAAVMLAMAVGGCLSLRRWRVVAFAALGLLAAVAMAVLHLRAQAAAEFSSGLGNSLAVRQVSVAQAWDYVSADPLRWLLGVGGTTRLGTVTLARIFNNPMFFLTDIGWVGVLFEYGAIGALLMLAVHLAGLRQALRWSRPDDPLSQAFADYIIYLLAASPIYSVVFTPGELTTIMALSFYFGRLRAAAPYGMAASQSVMPSPRHMALASRLALGPGPSGMASSG